MKLGRILLGCAAIAAQAGAIAACDERKTAPLPTQGGGAGGSGGAAQQPGSGGLTSGGTSGQAGSGAQAGLSGAGGSAGHAGFAGNGAGGAGGALGGALGSGGEATAGAAGSGGASGAAGSAGTRFTAYPPSPYPVENPDSQAKALLGKILFWDEQLGGDNTVACGTCHRPAAGGSDPRSALPAALQHGPDGLPNTEDDRRGSFGIVRCNDQGVAIGSEVQLTGRKAPTYLDAMFSPQLFWDGRAECRGQGCPSFTAFEDPDQPGSYPIVAGGALENQAIGPLMSVVEMACESPSWSALHAKISSVQPLALASQVPQELADFISDHGGSYPSLFEAAFGAAQTSGAADEVNTRRIAFAIATHERRLRSDQTPWDRWNAGDDSALTPAQVRGFDLFQNKARCGKCHQVPTFADGAFHYIGFSHPNLDQGRYAFDTIAASPGAMRTPTLRNVGLREAGGLLHSGAGPGVSLERIMELYNDGGKVNEPEIASVPISATMRPLNLTPDELADLTDFVRNGLTDPRVAGELAPFDRPRLSTE